MSLAIGSCQCCMGELNESGSNYAWRDRRLKGKFSWNIKSSRIQSVGYQIQDMIWRNIWLAVPAGWLLCTNQGVRVRNEDKPWLMINAGMLLASNRKLIFGRPVNTLGLTWKFVHCQVRANETYLEAKHQFSDRNRAVYECPLLSNPFISGEPRLSLLCSPRVRHCHFLFVDWCASRLAKLICSLIFLMASRRGSLSICCSLDISLRDLPPLSPDRVRPGISCKTWTIVGALTPRLSVVFCSSG